MASNNGYFKASAGSDYQPNNINGVQLKKTGKTVGQTNLKGSVNVLGQSLDNKNLWTDGKNTYVWVADGKNQGYYAKVNPNQSAINFKEIAANARNYGATYYNVNDKARAYYIDVSQQTHSQGNGRHGDTYGTTREWGSTDTYSNGGGGGYSVPSSNKTNITKMDELTKPKVLSADELAAQYGIDYNEQNILNDYNKATNEFYNNQIDYYDMLKNNYLTDNANYINKQLQDYADANRYANQNTTNKAARDANALSTYLSNTYTNAMNNLGMEQTLANLEQARQTELANNVYNAKTHYNKLGTDLALASATHNTADIQKYTDTLNSYNTLYTADRAYQSALAEANATKYSGLASAAGTNAEARAAKTNDYEQLYNQYKNLYGSSQAASSAYWKNQVNSQGRV